jgi:hypothetical protein
MDGWRLHLGRALAASNPHLEEEALGLVVQRLLERMLFLHLSGSLQEHCQGQGLYERLGAPGLPERLRVEDEALRWLLERLESHRDDLEELTADILGQAYERSLGRPARRAGGVYYTPASIVDYLVEGSVGRLLEQATLEDVSRLRFLDPACGSGMFLVRIYQRLLAWYEQRLARRLTLVDRERILLTHVFGVDADPHAVELARLSLLLQVRSGLSGPERQQALPGLEAQIKCGDSLVGTDWPPGVSSRPFDWQVEFPQVFSGEAPGFHAIVGNPPYDKLSGREDGRRLRAFKERYTCASYKPELYAIFAERALSLLAPGGVHGFIIPNSFLTGTTLRPLRQLLAEHNTLLDLAFLKDVRVFRDARLDSAVYLVARQSPSAGSTLTLRLADESVKSQPEQVQTLHLADWLASEGREFRITRGAEDSRLLGAIRQHATPLASLATVHLGLVPESNELVSDTPSRKNPDVLLRGRDIARYGPPVQQRWFSFARVPIVGGTKRQSIYQVRRIVMQSIRNLKLKRRLVATVAPAGVYTDGTVHNLLVQGGGVSLELLLGLLNSTLMNYYYSVTYPEHRIKGRYLESLPLRVPAQGGASAARIEEGVERMLGLHTQLEQARSEVRRAQLLRQLAAVDREIDRHVYALYGLDQELVAQVEAECPEVD